MSCPNTCSECAAIMYAMVQGGRPKYTGMYRDGRHGQGVADSIRQIPVPGRGYEPARLGAFDFWLTDHFRSLVARGLLTRLSVRPAYYAVNRLPNLAQRGPAPGLTGLVGGGTEPGATI